MNNKFFTLQDSSVAKVSQFIRQTWLSSGRVSDAVSPSFAPAAGNIS